MADYILVRTFMEDEQGVRQFENEVLLMDDENGQQWTDVMVANVENNWNPHSRVEVEHLVIGIKNVYKPTNPEKLWEGN